MLMPTYLRTVRSIDTNLLEDSEKVKYGTLLLRSGEAGPSSIGLLGMCVTGSSAEDEPDGWQVVFALQAQYGFIEGRNALPFLLSLVAWLQALVFVLLGLLAESGAPPQGQCCLPSYTHVCAMSGEADSMVFCTCGCDMV